MLVMLIGCGHPPASAPVTWTPALPRLLPPPPADPGARGAGYLAQVALQLQPGWGQFLDDCRLRLAASHPLNQMSLAATAELAVDVHGRVSAVTVASSGNADFDRAVRDAIADASPFPAPPRELLSDDDLVHLHWLFARDRRQAGPATAEIEDIQLPLAGVVERRVRDHDLARAARRIEAAPPGDERSAAIARVMIAALREALDSADSAVRRDAVAAIRRASVRELAPEVRDRLAVTSDTDLRLAATAAAAALDDRAAASTLLRQLAEDLPEHSRLAIAEVRALVQLGAASDAAAALRTALATTGRGEPSAVALDTLAELAVPDLAGKLAGWLSHGDARTRAGVCAAATAAGLDVAARWIASGLRDGDATVRARCIDAAAAQGRRHAGDPRIAGFVPALRELAHARDRIVRARAIAALVALAPDHAPEAADDPAPEVRAAYAAALAAARPADAADRVRELLDDRDADVRAAAWAAFAAGGAEPADRAQLAVHAASDSAPQVRLAAVPAIDDDALLAHLAADDVSPEVRTEALVRLAGRRGRAASEGMLLDRLAAAPAGNGERVRAALAWLLAR